MRRNGRHVLLRYWGSHFKSPRQVRIWVGSLAPAVSRGWRCFLVLERPPADATWLEELRAGGIEPVFVPRPKRHFELRCVLTVRALCRQLGVDVIHCENIYTSPLLGAFLARVPARLWTKNNMNVHFAECRQPTLREKIAISTRTAAAVATKIIAVSNAVKSELSKMGISARHIVVHPNYRSALPEGPYDRAGIRADLGYGESDVVVVTVGHAVPVKGWDILLQAFKKVVSQVPHSRLLLVGSTTAPSEQACFADLKALIGREQLAGVVKFTGHVHDVCRLLAAADVFVLSSRSEAYALALVEALEMGLPCVSTRVGIAENVINDGVNGFLVDRDNWAELADKLQMITSDPERRACFARAVSVPGCIPSVAEFGERLCVLYESVLPR